MLLSHIKFNRLTTRFFLIYLFVVILPTFLLGIILYSDSKQQMLTKIINTEKESLMSDKYYIEYQFQYIEEKYNQFKVSDTLADVLENNISTPRDVMYTFVNDIRHLFISNQHNNPYIDQINIYSSNETAVEILPQFLGITELYDMDISQQFLEDPQKELFRQFWMVQNVDGELKLTFLAGFMNSIYSDISGVLSITCNDKLFELLLNGQNKNISTYIYWNNALIYSYNDNNEQRNYLLANEESFFNISSDIDVTFNSTNNILKNVIRLKDQNIIIVQLKDLSSESFMVSPFSTSFLVCALLFFLSNIILLPTVYLPLRNITLLAKHMKQTNSHKLIPYSGPVTNDEIGDLIKEYNSMVKRTNNMSDTIRKKELLLKNAQIEALQSQLNPHFFYGTLESIRMIAEAHQEELIADIAYTFGNLMRYSLSREYFVIMQKEIDIVKQYIEIQKKRIGDRFTVKWNINASTQDCFCPKFILFFMVENAIVHNVAKTRKHIDIDIDIIQKKNDISITVTNSGPGISAKRLAEIQYLLDHPEKRSSMSSKNNGRSIFNINDRLQLYYGSNYKFSIDSKENIKTVCNVRFNINRPKIIERALEEIHYAESSVG